VNDELRNEISAILSEVLNIPIASEENPMRSRTAYWDSLNHMELILRLEEQYQVRFTIKEAADIESLEDIVRLIGVKS
jgi:Acyl carrier protein